MPEKIEYIRRLLVELSGMAKDEKRVLLSYLIEIAVAEIDDVQEKAETKIAPFH
jgi:hypothetical protein